ncbi:max-like protein X [Parasteatoda tepidariorum]|uniref:max-like protein X n=1 Tax=Parasteatoda tepidariorum TaxID=114398 RepID=UPI00077F9832|nr:max-like protein X [Parasteatoda tepidariorum]XP_015929316.1 max-like protein X [Parasteatoda tepidariorum]
MAESHFTESKFDSGSENDLLSPHTGSLRYSFSSTSSAGSLDLFNSSSAHNSDDEDSDDKPTLTYKERRREAHTQAEQKRRDAIKRGYEDLQSLVPTCHQQDSISSYKLSKAAILQKSIDYIHFLLQQKKKQDEELVALRKEVRALEIMKTNYEAIVKVHQSQPNKNSNKVSEDMKFQVFQAVCDTLFQSFNSAVSISNFGELSACVFSWLEEYCKPQTLQELMISLFYQLNYHVT